MKTIRYILILFVVLTIQTPLRAQNLAQDPSMMTFQSTSTMPMSGSSLSASQDGGWVTVGAGQPRRVGGNSGQPGEPIGPDEDRPEPNPNPIGAVPMLLMLALAGGYAIWRRPATR